MATYKLLKTETIMADDSIIYPMYVYIVDNVFRRQDKYIVALTVAEWKELEGYKEIRQCELFEHGDACLGDRVEPE